MDGQSNLVPREQIYGAIENLPASPPYSTLEMMPPEKHLRDYLLVLRKHMWLILAFFLATVTIVTVATFRMQPIYQATARIEIDREDLGVLPFTGTAGTDGVDEDLESYTTTQMKILTSQTMAQQTIKSLKLDQDPRFGGHPGNASSLEVKSASNGVVPSAPPALGAFLGGLTVIRVPNSRLVDVTFTTVDPQLAARIVNAHVNNFIDQNFRSHYDSTVSAAKWLSSQLDDLKSKVESSEDARIQYERENQIFLVNGKEDASTQKLEELNHDLTQAQSDRINKESVFQLVQAGNFDAVPAVRESPVIQDILKQKSTLDSQYADALNQYGPKFPKVLRLQEQIKNLDQFLIQEKKNIANQIEAEYVGTQQRESLLQHALDQQKSETAAMADKMVEYNILQRDADANKQMYDGLLEKLKEAGITAGLRSNNIRVVDPAYAPTGPSGPNKQRNISLAILIGLVGGVGLAVLREYLDNTVKNPDDIEMLGRLPSLAVVPVLDSSNGHRRGPMSKLLKSPAMNGNAVELVSHAQPQSNMAEAFRALRTSLLLSQADRPPQVILLTSPLPKEGKTTAAVNLAITLAQLGDSTLLIDADLRKPGVSRALNMTGGKYAGLSSYLAGVGSLDLVSIPHPDISNLTVIPTGPVPPNPADLLSSHRLAAMLTELRQRYKFIVIDSPPTLAATDAVILSVVVDGVLLVVRSGETPKEAFTRTRDLLMSVKCHMLGVVINAVDSSSSNYYYSYHYYPHSYGDYGHEDRDQTASNDTEGLELDI